MRRVHLIAFSILLIFLQGCGGETGKVAESESTSELSVSKPVGQPDETNSKERAKPQSAPKQNPSSLEAQGSTLTGTEQDPSSMEAQGSTLTGKASDLEGLVSELNGRVTETKIIIDLPSDVLFDFDQATIRPSALPKLRKLARLIKKAGKGLVQVNGHTDSKGGETYNLKLSRRRAEAVATWLAGQGKIDAARLETKGYGESRPVAPNKYPDGSDRPEGRQKNRRVEVVLPKR